MLKTRLMPASPEAYQLLHRGAVCFSRIERAGLRVDVGYLDNAIKETRARIAALEGELRRAEEYRVWQKHFGDRMNLQSKEQLGRVVFDVLGHPRNKFLGAQNNVAAFEHLKLPFVRAHQDVMRLKTALVRNLIGLRNETVGGYLHAFQDLHTAESYRSSSSRPNLHNQPVRNKDVMELVRRSIIPRRGRRFLHMDYSTQEVRASYWYHGDGKLLYDIEHGDMHRDRSYDIFLLTPEQLGDVKKGTGKAVRGQVKNRFVFREFYGGVYFQAAPDLWNDIAIFDLKRSDGVSLYEHLAASGISELGACDPEYDPEPGTFEHRVWQVERRMWDESYVVYDRWRRDWWDLYQENGGVNTLTGFLMYGVFRRNQVLCDPIQGVAFHCLLLALIEIQNEFLRLRMKSLVVNQVHDSGMFDVPDEEFDDAVAIVREIGLNRVRKIWPWISCELGLELEVSPAHWAETVPLEAAA